VEAIERISASNLPGEGKVTTTLFESGLLLAFDHGAERLFLYRTDRVNFRSFHRSVSREEAGSFRLTPLGESEAEGAGDDPNK
jgi:hypothetical protein